MSFPRRRESGEFSKASNYILDSRFHGNDKNSMKNFTSEFNTLNYIIKKSDEILLVAHTGPDGDTVGSVSALKEYLQSLGKTADIACFDPLPDYFKSLIPFEFKYPDRLDLKSYDAVIASDSVERGFDKIKPQLSENQATALIDHHPDITIHGDVKIINSKSSSACEIIYDYLEFNKVKITKNLATFLMIGLSSDTGNFQHSNTTVRVMEIASNLIRSGASLSKIVNASFADKKISTLKLWGRAFEKAKINPKNNMILTVITQKDIAQCGASIDDIAEVSSILNTVPGANFSLVLSQRDGKTIKGSLRSEEYKGTNVSDIAHQFGGGGHKFASGFEIKGKIVETGEGWRIV